MKVAKRVLFWVAILLFINLIIGSLGRVFGFRIDIVEAIVVGSTILVLCLFLLTIIAVLIYGIIQVVKIGWDWAYRK